MKLSGQIGLGDKRVLVLDQTIEDVCVGQGRSHFSGEAALISSSTSGVGEGVAAAWPALHTRGVASATAANSAKSVTNLIVFILLFIGCLFPGIGRIYLPGPIFSRPLLGLTRKGCDL